MIDGCSLLLVDDDPGALFLLDEMRLTVLPESSAVTASYAREAFDHCIAQDFDCIVVDYSLPDEDGLSLAKRLRERFPYLPIVLCTGMGDEMIARDAMLAGVNDYLSKSALTPNALGRAVSNAMKLADRARVIDTQNEDIEAFAHAMAHDFRQPVRQMMTFSGLLQQAVDGKDGAEARACVGFIQQAASRLNRLIDVLSEYSLMHRNPALTNIDLEPLAADVCHDLCGFIAERNGAVSILGVGQAWGNDALMRQVLQNLIVNGLKYNEADRPHIEVLIEQGTTELTVRVRDNGIGIEKRHLEFIFAPLARLHNNSDIQGSGLGLTLTRKAVLLMEGSIRCRSQPGEGSEFTVTLPREGRLIRDIMAQSLSGPALHAPTDANHALRGSSTYAFD